MMSAAVFVRFVGFLSARTPKAETSASSKASRICAKRLPASIPGWISSVAAWVSARMRPDHSGPE
jgi:hypothetical protein